MWECRHPLCWRFIVQWVDKDQFGLLTAEEGPRIFHHEADGRWLYTQQELAARLQQLGAKRVAEQRGPVTPSEEAPTKEVPHG